MTNDLKFTNLDFDQIKSSLKEFMQNQDRFRDYDFAGSNMNVLLDVLAYNTFTNNHYNNMAISEMFLDSAKIKSSVISHAKELNYTPRSRTSSSATLDVLLSVAGSPAFITLPEKTQFTAKCANKTYTFTNTKSHTITPENGTYKLSNLEVHEGEWKTELYVITSDTTAPVPVNDIRVDTDSLEVTVRTDLNATPTSYALTHNLFGVAADANVFYVEPAADDKYDIIFGNDIFGNQPSVGNIVEIKYRVCNGDSANGIDNIQAASDIAGYSASVTTIKTSSGGAERENIESIKYYAPKTIQIQDRAVTGSDYETLLRNAFPEVQAVSVYGGEEATPPQYGRVIVAVDVDGADGISDTTKKKFKDYLGIRSPLAIEPIVESAKFMYIGVTSTVKYDTVSSNKSSADIKSLITTTIKQYSDDNLADFKKNVRHSKLTNAIDSADSSIVSNDTSIRAIVDISVIANKSETFQITFMNALQADHPIASGDDLTNHTPAIKSSSFLYNGSTAIMQDDGNGNIDIIKMTSSVDFVYLAKKIGTVNYDTGEVEIANLDISASATNGIVKIYARTVESDIFGPNDRIMSIRDEDIIVEVKEERK